MKSAFTTLVLIAACMTWPSPASSAYIHNPDGTTAQPFARWAQTSLMPAPNMDITMHVGDNISDDLCEDAPACALEGHIYIDTATDNGNWYATDYITRRMLFYHELGHNLDFQATEAHRLEFQRLRYLDGMPWLGDSYSSSEQWAEAYVTCATVRIKRGMMEHEFLGGGAGYDPSIARHKKICSLLRRAALGLPAI